MNRVSPAFYVNITERCNMKCEYCPTFGENWEQTDVLLPQDQLRAIVEAAVTSGIVTFRISGGEPFLYPERVFLILSTLNQLGISDIVLNTNGFNLANLVDRIALHRIAKLKVSLDSLDANLFQEITASKQHDKVLDGILRSHASHIPTEVNMVVLRKNADEFWRILDFCEAHGVALKLLDLVLYDSLVRNELSPEEYWREEYFDLHLFVPELTIRYGVPETVFLSNQRGIPMLRFTAKHGCTITLKSGRMGSTFADVCRTCNLFPCQEGLFHLSLSAAGNLTPCRLRRDLTRSLRELSTAKLLDAFTEMLYYYHNSYFVEDTVKYYK